MSTLLHSISSTIKSEVEYFRVGPKVGEEEGVMGASVVGNGLGMSVVGLSTGDTVGFQLGTNVGSSSLSNDPSMAAFTIDSATVIEETRLHS